MIIPAISHPKNKTNAIVITIIDKFTYLACKKFIDLGKKKGDDL